MDFSGSEFEEEYKILIIGDLSSGKSSILLRFTNDFFPTTHESTIGVDFKLRIIRVGGKQVRCNIWDTAGQDRFRTITASYYRGADGVIIVYDITRRDSFANLRTWMDEIDKYCSSDRLQKMLVGNKLDLESERVVTFEEGKVLADSQHIPFLEASAKNNYHINEIFTTLCARIQEKDTAVARTRAPSANTMMRVTGTAGFGFNSTNNVARRSFPEKIKSRHVPLPTDVTFQDICRNYYFNLLPPTETKQDGFTVCTSYAASPDPFARGPVEHYVALSLQLPFAQDARQPTQIAVILNLSSSAALEQAREGLLPLVTQLNDSDSLTVLEALDYTDRSAPAGWRELEPLSPLEQKDMATLRAKLIQNLQPKGTKTSSNASMFSLIPAIRRACELIESCQTRAAHQRLLLLTDRLLRDPDVAALLVECKKLAKKRISVSVISFGVELSPEFVEAVSQVRGANSFNISSGEQLRKLLGAGLEFVLQPIALNFSLRFESVGWELQHIYGSTRADLTNTIVWQTSSIFSGPSPDMGASFGGVILLRLRRKFGSNVNTYNLVLTYEDACGSEIRRNQLCELPQHSDEYYGSKDVQKAVLLARYVNLLQTWCVDQRSSSLFRNPSVSVGQAIVPPQLASVEFRRGDIALQLSDAYRSMFNAFSVHFAAQMREIEDATLEAELGSLHQIINAPSITTSRSTGCCT